MCWESLVRILFTLARVLCGLVFHLLCRFCVGPLVNQTGLGATLEAIRLVQYLSVL